jgi:hypothetical protein
MPTMGRLLTRGVLVLVPLSALGVESGCRSIVGIENLQAAGDASVQGGSTSGGGTANGGSAGTAQGGGTGGTVGGGGSGGTATGGTAGQGGASGGQSGGGSGGVAGTTGGGGASGSGGVAGGGPVTMGVTTLLGASDSNSMGIFAQIETAPVSGTVTSLSFYIDPGSSPNSGASILLGVYSDTGAFPNQLLAETSSVTDPTPGAWLTLSLTSSLSVTQGTSYWLAYEVSGSSINYLTGPVAGGKICGASVTFGPMPATFPSPMSCNGYPWSFYATIQP